MQRNVWLGETVSGICVRVALVLAVLLGAMVPLGADAATGKVVATDSVNIRACPTLECQVIGAASLGDDIEITGAKTNGFFPVRWFGVDGWAHELYVMDGSTAPWFRESDAWCNRVGFVFNIGIGYTPSQAVLNTLVSEHVPATMFPMGSFARSQPGYLQQLDDAGFVIGTHGDQNLFLTAQTDAVIRQDVTTSVAAIEQVIGRSMDPYFTPYAADTDNRVRRVVSDLGLLPVGWTIAANDYASTATESAVYNRVMGSIYPGAVIEFHLDGPATAQSTARALPRIIRDLRAQGYDFATIPDMAEPCGLTWPVQPAPTAKVLASAGSLRCRTLPSTSGGIITSVASNGTVPVRGKVFNGWVPVSCSGRNGWMSGDYLTISNPATPTPTPVTPTPTTPPVTPTPTTPPVTPTPGTATGTVTGTGGATLRCRSLPSTGGAILTSLAPGAVVPVRGASINGWTPVRCANVDGWVSSQYLTVNSGSTPTPSPTPSPRTGTVVNTGGDNLRCRTGPGTGYAVIVSLAPGAVVTVRGGVSNGWVPVTCGGRSGWVSDDYLRVN